LSLTILGLIGESLVIGCGRLSSFGSKPDNSDAVSSDAPASNAANANNTDPKPISGTPLYNRENYSDRAGEIAKVKTKTKLDPDRRVEGKVAIITKPYDFSTDYTLELFTSAASDFLDTFDMEKYGVAKDQIAQSLEELDTLVRLSCDTKKLGTYTLSNGRSIPAKGLDCTVEMIDYKAGVIFAKKTFRHGELDDFVTVDPDSEDFTN